jgi:hypothetical protein
MLGLVASLAVADGFRDNVRPFVTRYCIDCHSTADKTADVDLERFASAADMAADPAPWQLVADQLRSGAMPPHDAPQPGEEELAAVRGALRGELLAIAARTAGDPGPVVLRRLSNAEYKASLRDLTGVATLDPGKEFPVDGAAGDRHAIAAAPIDLNVVEHGARPDREQLDAARRIFDAKIS